MTGTAVFACRNARNARWQLGGASPHGGPTLIGWRQSPRSEDGGVPGEVAALLADAFAAVARVTFPCSTEPPAAAEAWVGRGADHVRTFVAAGLTGVVQAALRRAPREVVLVSTWKTESIVRLFDDGAYPWWMQGTFALLSAPDGPPEIDRAQIGVLLAGPGGGDLNAVSAAIEAIVRPGVDGDLAGVLSRTTAFEERLLDAVASACARRGVPWAVVSEEEFSGSFTS